MVGLWALLGTWASVATAGGVVIESVVECPVAAAVAERLAPLLSGDPGGHRLLVLGGRDGAQLRLRLEDPTGRVVSERLWPASSDCARGADEVAVVAAAWLMPATAAGATLDPLPPLQASEPAPVPVARAVAGPDGRRSSEIGINGGVGRAMGGASSVAATRGALGLVWGRGGSHAGLLAVELTASGPWRQSLDDGQARVRWGEASLAIQVGMAARSASGRLSATLTGGFSGGVVFVATPPPAAASGQVLGEVAAVAEARGLMRLGAGVSAPRLWVGVPVAFGLLRHRLAADPAGGTVEAPRVIWGPLLGMEFSFSR